MESAAQRNATRLDNPDGGNDLSERPSARCDVPLVPYPHRPVLFLTHASCSAPWPFPSFHFTENFLPKVDGVTRTLARLLEHLNAEGHEALVCGPETGMVRAHPSILPPSPRRTSLIHLASRFATFRPSMPVTPSLERLVCRWSFTPA